MSDRPRRRLAAIVAADVASYSRLIGLDEEGTLNTLRKVRRDIVDPHLNEHGGRVANTAGDSLLLEFSSVVDAVRCALAMQRALAERNADVPDERRLEFRVGINVGDVVSEGNDLLGDGVNIAARMEGLAEAGGIALSDDAYRQVRDRIDVSWSDAGEHELKNIARPVRVWRWSAQRTAAKPRAPVASGSGPMLPDKPSIAVLPFDNMSGDQEQAYFADGITEDIITEISKIPGLLVISRNSTFTYKGKATKAQDVCSDLGVRYVMEGSVRKAGERVRITAQLIDGNSGGHIWAERYDRNLADIFAVQDDVTEKIVRALEIKLGEGARGRLAREETDTPEAYDCVLRGREQYRLFSRDANRKARDLYEAAIELDPNYAAAHAGLAMTFLHEWFMGSSDALDRAFELALKANALDASLPLVYEALGNIHLFKKQYDEAVAAIRKWVEIEPGNADAYANLAGVLHFTGQPDRCIPLIDKAMRLNPFYPFYYILYRGQAYLAMGRYEEALEALKRAATHNPEALPAQVFLAACFGLLGKQASAQEALAEAFTIHPGLSTMWVKTFLPYKRSADSDRLIAGLRKAGLRE